MISLNTTLSISLSFKSFFSFKYSFTCHAIASPSRSGSVARIILEEFFAASAYLSGEADQLGSLKGQDIGKAIVVVGIIIGVIALTVGNILGESSNIGGSLLKFTGILKDVILN